MQGEIVKHENDCSTYCHDSIIALVVACDDVIIQAYPVCDWFIGFISQCSAGSRQEEY